jgi:hypothetical protein
MKRPHSIKEWLFTISAVLIGYSAIIWGVAWIVGYNRYVARPALLGIGVGVCLLLIASFIEFCMEWPTTLKSKIFVGCICGGVFIAGLLFQHWPEPANPWLLIFTGFTIALRPFAAVGFFAALLVPVRPINPHS